MGNSNSGRGGLDPGRLAEIQRLLAVRPALEKKAIARQVGVAPSTIHRVIERLRRAAAADVDAAPVIGRQTIRCTGCGGQVLVAELPCRLCLVRAKRLRALARLARWRARWAKKRVPLPPIEGP